MNFEALHAGGTRTFVEDILLRCFFFSHHLIQLSFLFLGNRNPKSWECAKTSSSIAWRKEILHTKSLLQKFGNR